VDKLFVPNEDISGLAEKWFGDFRVLGQLHLHLHVGFDLVERRANVAPPVWVAVGRESVRSGHVLNRPGLGMNVLEAD